MDRGVVSRLLVRLAECMSVGGEGRRWGGIG